MAIGVELGPTPVTRLGIRGDRSVRCAASRAVSTSETIQLGLDGTQTALGPEAYAAAPYRVRQIFQYGPADNLDYDAVDALACFGIAALSVEWECYDRG